MDDTVATDDPLAGVRVLDLSGYLAGPFATHQLGDLGAEVVKVEAPAGDPARAGVGMRAGEPASPFMVALHRDRRSVVLDLKDPTGRSVFFDLARRADVLVENFRPGITDRLGIAYDDLRAVNDRLIYCSITGFGPDGPASQAPAIDGPVQARAGVFEYTAGDGGAGGPVAMTIADIAGGVGAVEGVLAALYRRERTGRGGHVEISLFESLLQWTVTADRPRSLAPPVTLVGTGSDGRAFIVQTPLHFQDRLLELVARVPGCADLRQDRRFATPEARAEHAGDFQDALARAFGTRPAADWLADLEAAGVPAGVVQGIEEALADPQLAHRSAAARLDMPGMGPTRVALSPFVFDGHRRTVTTPPPTLGQHTREVLGEWLGHDDPAIDRLATDGAFGAYEPA